MSTFPRLSIYFTDWYLIRLFFTVRIFRSDTPYAKKIGFFHVYSYASLLFTDWYFVYLFHSQNVSFCNSICRIGFFLIYQSDIFHVLVPCLPLRRSEYFLQLHHRQGLKSSSYQFFFAPVYFYTSQ